MGLIFVILAGYMIAMTRLRPSEPRAMPVSRIDVTPHPKQYVFGGAVIAMTAVLYIIFW